MVEIIYSHSLFAAWVLLFFFGGYFIIGKVPEKPIFASYKRSRVILGFALLIFGLQIWLQWMFDFRGRVPYIATALNLSCYYLEAILFGMSFISLLNSRYLSLRRTCIDVSKWILFEIVIWSDVMFCVDKLRYGILIGASLFFFIDASRISILFFKTYRETIRKVQNYYAENEDRFVRWLSKSVYGVVFFGLIGAVLAFAPKWLVALYMLGGIALFIYIFVCFQNYIINYEEVETAVSEDLEEIGDFDFDLSNQNSTLEKSQLHTTIETKLNIWKTQAHGYRQSRLTIDHLAREIGTNRTYLSNYINSTYQCTFREWISLLRIEDAKSMLLQNNNLLILEVAEKVGFTSAAHLNRVFKQYENVSPSQWREKMEFEKSPIR